MPAPQNNLQGDLPPRTLTFLFTDVQGSTRLWEEYPDAMRAALARHDALLRRDIEGQSGRIFKTAGDAFHAAFAEPGQALAAALAAQSALHAEEWPLPGGVPLRVRMALHVGAAEERGGDFFGAPLGRAARLLAAAHGGQTLVSEPLAALLAGGPLGPDVSLRSLGRHRLKDLAQPQEVFQLSHPSLPHDFPPLRSLEAFTHNLPSQLSSFIGRDGEMTEARRLLTQTRLLTLTGTGGAGKTRLALQAAAEAVEDYPDGVWLVELASLRDPALLAQTVAAVLGVGEEGGPRSLAQTLADALRPKSLLLVWDNCEHLVDACARLAETLLRACPGLRLLATSREALEIGGEVVLVVSSLALPPVGPRGGARAATPETLAGCDSVRLFVERATTALPAFRLSAGNAPAVALVCARLDGIPLALELAAARVRVLTPEQIAGRLDDRFRLLSGGSRTALPRQQTLRALIDWSYDLLPAPEKTLLRRLSVFAGGWALEAAESVCSGEDVAEREVLDLLSRLVAKSLVMVEPPDAGQVRYRLLENLRSYARERLMETAEADAIAARHAAWFLAFAEEARPKLSGPEQALWLDRLERDHDNLRAALRACQQTDPGVGLRLARALAVFWRIRGYLSEGCGWLGLFLGAAPDAPDPDRANALNAFGTLNWSCGDFVAARAAHESCLGIMRALADQNGVATALNNIALATEAEGDLDAARHLYEESLAIYRALGMKGKTASVLVNLSTLDAALGDNRVARGHLEESLLLLQDSENTWAMAMAQDNLGLVCGRLGDYSQAHAHLRACFTTLNALKDNAATAAALNTLASLCVMQRNDAAAVRFFGAVEALRQSLGLTRPPSEVEDHRLYTEALRERLGPGAYAAAWEQGRALNWLGAMEYALETTAAPAFDTAT